jgi:UDP-N-acetylmuramyl tripeptide synthase
MPPPNIRMRSRAALALGGVAGWASRTAGRGAGSVIGGRVALALDASVLHQLGAGRRTVLVTGTNGKTTTTRMVAAALATLGPVATNAEGANMDAGLVVALAAQRQAEWAVLEVDELYLPRAADALDPAAIVLLNLSRDQLDRVGEIHRLERTLRASLARHPGAVQVANGDDVLMTSAAHGAERVVWVAAGGGWAHDSVSCPRSGERIVREGDHWYSTGAELARPTPHWWFDAHHLHGPHGLALPMQLALPGAANRGNAALAIATAVAMGANPQAALAAVARVDQVAGRYRSVRIGAHLVRILLAKNPAGWQEALSMVDPRASAVAVAVNGRPADGRDLSWLWDVQFERFLSQFPGVPVVAAGERATDLAVRLAYAGVPHAVVPDLTQAVRACPPGRVEVMVNYTAFQQLGRAWRRQHG